MRPKSGGNVLGPKGPKSYLGPKTLLYKGLGSIIQGLAIGKVCICTRKRIIWATFGQKELKKFLASISSCVPRKEKESSWVYWSLMVRVQRLLEPYYARAFVLD